MTTGTSSSSLIRLRQYLLSGVSHVIPFVACGGILIAAAIACVPMAATGPDFSQSPQLKTLLDIGVAAMSLVVPVLAGYIAFGMVERPGLVPGFVGGAVSNSIGAGFLGGIAAGLIAGWTVMLIKRFKAPAMIRPIMPILVIPVISSLVVGGAMYWVLGVPIKDLMGWMAEALKGLNGGNQVFLAMILGAMIAFDMGGPVNKAAFFFGAAMIKEGNYAVMGACAAAICVPPLGLGLATLFRRASWSEQERTSGTAALAMGAIGITEGAIPFAAADPLRVIPCIILGSMSGAVVAMLGGAGNHAPHGGLIVLPVVDGRLAYLAGIAIGSTVVALSLNLLRAQRDRNSTKSA